MIFGTECIVFRACRYSVLVLYLHSSMLDVGNYNYLRYNNSSIEGPMDMLEKVLLCRRQGVKLDLSCALT